MIPIARPLMDEREAEAARRVILGGWLTQGPEVAAFEREFAAAVGATHACAVSNCTAALQLALSAVGVRPGDEVVTVSHSFIATANSVRHCGATPVFVDIEPDGHNMDPALVEAAVTPRTRAILCVHQMGMPCDLRRLGDLAASLAIPLVEDAACALGSTLRVGGAWQPIGRPHGRVACFSLHPRKVISTGDGGMATTDDPAIDARLRLLRQHAMDVADTVRHRSREVVFESYPETGFNFRLTDLQAAVGREQLRRLPEIVRRRREAADRYRGLLARIDGLEPPREPPWARSNWQSYCVRLPDGVDQRRAMQRMLDLGVATRRGIMCSHREAAYAGVPPRAPLPRSERAQDRCVLLPLYPQITEEEQAHVADSLRDACGQA